MSDTEEAAARRERYAAEAEARRDQHDPGCPAPTMGGDCDCDAHERVHVAMGETDPDCPDCERAWETWNMGSGL